MIDARIMLSDDMITASLRRGKQTDRNAPQPRDENPSSRNASGKHRSNKFQPRPANSRRAAHQEGD
jgi:hypothetical protein